MASDATLKGRRGREKSIRESGKKPGRFVRGGIGFLLCLFGRIGLLGKRITTSVPSNRNSSGMASISCETTSGG
jgi:hypothetical protein